MESALIEIGQQVVNLAAVAGAKWERDKLFVYLVGGRFLSLQGDEARLLWEAICSNSVKLASYTT